MEGFVGLIHNKDGEEHNDAVFEYAEESSEETIGPAQMNGSQEACQQFGGNRKEDGYR